MMMIILQGWESLLVARTSVDLQDSDRTKARPGSDAILLLLMAAWVEGSLAPGVL